MAKSKEINIDEILTRSKKQAEEKKQKQSRVIDSDTGEDMTQAQASTKTKQPFPGFGGSTGMPGNFSDILQNPDIMKMFSGGTMPGVKSLPLKQRIMFKLMGFFAKPGRVALLRNKLLWPIWIIAGLIALVLAFFVGILFLIYRLIKMLITPYIDIFRKKS